MKGAQITEHSGSVESEGSPTFVAVKIRIPPIPECEVAWPRHNFIGQIILAKLLEARIRAQGTSVLHASGVGELNQASVLLLVNDRFAAIVAARQALAECALSGAATIGWFCAAEGIWRAAWPHSGVVFEPGRDLDQLEAAAQEFERALLVVDKKLSDALAALEKKLAYPEM